MSDDSTNRPVHAGTDADETPFDHGCDCSVCQDYREEVRDAVRNKTAAAVTDQQFEDYMRLRRDHRGDQATLSSF